MIGPALLHSVSYAGLWGQAFLPVDEFVDKAGALGYQGVMLMAKRPHVSVLDFGSRERARLHSRIEKNGLKAVCIAGYTNFTADLEHGDIPHREIQIQHVTELARLAQDVGGSLVRVFTGYEASGPSFSAQWKLVVDGAARSAPHRAAHYGVTIGVQNHHDIAVSTEALLSLIEAVGEPNCRGALRRLAPALHGDDLAAAAMKMGGAHRAHHDRQLSNAPPVSLRPVDRELPRKPRRSWRFPSTRVSLTIARFSMPSVPADFMAASPTRSARQPAMAAASRRSTVMQRGLSSS